MCPLKSTETSLHDNCDIGEQLEQCALVDDVDGSDDDFDEADDPCPLFLGFVVDDLENQASLLEVFPNKAGGTPTWLDPVRLPSGSASVCDFCKEPLQFVLQINAPLDEKESAYHRTIFVFMCPSMACLRKDQHAQQRNSNEGLTRSVKVFRCQMPAVNPFYTIDIEIAQGIADQQRFRAALCSWCNTPGKEINYVAVAEVYAIVPRNIRSSTGVQVIKIIANKQSTLLGHLRLIYLMGADETIMSMLDCFEGDEDKQCWASFQAHVSKDSAQVLRCWKEEGKPLWPELRGRPSTADIPNCNYCGCPLRFEFQIMPQLLAYFKVQNEGDSLDWATIAIYTCEASCDSSLVYKEEFPWVQLYS